MDQETKQYVEGHVISLVEHLDAQQIRPFYIVAMLQMAGFERSEAVELYNKGTLAWTVPE